MRNVFVLGLALSCINCGLSLGITAAKSLDDEQITTYIQAYRNVRALVPNLEPPSANMASLKKVQAETLEKIDAAVKKAGLSGYQEFVLLSAKVGAALGVVEAKELGSSMNDKVDAGRAGLEKALRNPHLPEDAKAQLQAKLAATQAQVDDGKEWAQKLLVLIDSFSSDASQDTVRRHREALRAAFR